MMGVDMGKEAQTMYEKDAAHRRGFLEPMGSHSKNNMRFQRGPGVSVRKITRSDQHIWKFMTLVVEKGRHISENGAVMTFQKKHCGSPQTSLQAG